MRRSCRWNVSIALVGLVALALSACGAGASAPPPCGVSGSADEAAFAQHFSAMSLIDDATGQPGPEDPEFGTTFAPTQRVAVSATALDPVLVRFCVRERSQASKVVSDNDASLGSGANRVTLGALPAGPYVVAAIVDGVVVRNLQLLIR